MTPKEMYDELWNDNGVFDDFVEEWMKKHPEKVNELIADWLDDRIIKSWTDETDEYSEFVETMVEHRYADAIDAAYEAQRELEMWEEKEKK